MSLLSDRWRNVLHRIRSAEERAGRARDSVSLVAVSKRHSPSAMRELCRLGQQDFGENYLQEALQKLEALSDCDIVWHFIGALQSNKTRAVAENFHWVHTVDRLKIASRLSEQRPSSLAPLNVCVQVNVEDEESKSGIRLDETEALARDIAALPNLRLRGLMAIPKPAATGDPSSAFNTLGRLFSDLAARYDWPYWDTLSIGMSADLEAAVRAGATQVRIGTDIFGPRP